MRLARLIAVVALALTTASPLLAESASCHLQIRARGYLPLQVGTGAVIGAGSDPVPWSFSARLLPTLAFGQSGTLRVAGVGGVSYNGSTWYPLYGGSLGWRVVNAPLELLGVEVAAEAVWGVDDRFPLAAAVTLDLGTVLTLQARGTPNVGDDLGFLEVGFGVHLTTVARAAFPPRDPQPPPMFSLEADPYFIEEQTIRVLFNMVYTERIVDDVRKPYVNCDVVRQFAAYLEVEETSTSPDVAALRDGMDQNGLRWFSDLISGTDGIIERARIKWESQNPGSNFAPSQTEQVSSIVSGIIWSVNEAFDSKLPST